MMVLIEQAFGAMLFEDPAILLVLIWFEVIHDAFTHNMISHSHPSDMIYSTLVEHHCHHYLQLKVNFLLKEIT